MRIIPTGDRRKIAIIAAKRHELTALQRYEHLKQFNANITTQPEKSEEYQCFVVVYTFDSQPQARLFRLAYSLAKGRFKHVKRVYPSSHKPPSYYAAKKASNNRRRLRKQRTRSRKNRVRLIPLMRAGKISDLEAKARQIARELLIIDLL